MKQVFIAPLRQDTQLIMGGILLTKVILFPPQHAAALKFETFEMESFCFFCITYNGDN